MSSVTSERIKARRKALRLSQRDLAALSGIPQNSISRYERGNSEMSVSTIIAMAKALQTSTDWLLGLTDELIVEGELDDRDRELLELLHRHPAIRDKIYEMAKLLVAP